MLIQFYRFKDWYKSIGIFILGLTLKLDVFSLVSLIIPVSIAAHTFSINNYFDYFIKGEKNVVKNLVKKYDKRVLFSLCILPLFPLFLYPYPNLRVILLVILIIIFADSYSCPQTRFKENGIFGLIMSSICGALFFLIGYFHNNEFLTQESIFLSIVFFNYLLISEVIHQLSDPSEKLNSLPKILGFKRTKKIAKFIVLMACFIAICFLFFSYPLYPSVSLVFSLVRFIRLSKTKNYKWLRDHLYGLHEGISYLILNFLS